MSKTKHLPVVYYVARKGFEDTLKIGTTNNLTRRLARLRKTYHEDLEVLATEPDLTGSLESQRHRQFHEDRILGEWFWNSLSLRAHVLSLKSKAVAE